MSETSPTPLAIRIMVIVQLLMLVMAGGFLLDAPGPVAWPAALVLLAQAMALWGIWSLRRWGVITYALFLVINLVLLAKNSTSTTGVMSSLVFVIVLRGAVLVPAVWYRALFR